MLHRALPRRVQPCRAWRAATTHPSFDRALAERPPAVAKVTSDLTVFDRRLGNALNFDLFRGRWHRSNDVRRNAGPYRRAIAWSDEHRLYFYGTTGCRFHFRGSWDGVLCFEPYNLYLQLLHRKPAGAEAYVLWNPLTEAFATVPAPAGGGRVIGGYAHPVTRRFHLLHSSDDEAVPGRDDLLAPVTFRILRVGDTRWRELPPLQDGTSIFMKSDRDRPVSVHGNLHWLVQSGTRRVTLLVFDTVREKFRLMAPPDRPGLRLETARTALSGGKLCVLALATPPSAGTMEMWVLDDYPDPGACWRLRERVRMVRLDGADLSPTFVAATAVEVVEGVEEGEEIFLRLEDRIDAYNVREDAWRRVSVAMDASLVMHGVSVLPPQISFGDAARALVECKDIFGHVERCFWED